MVSRNPIVTMKIKEKGTIIIELFPDQAPQTVRNFISLITKGFYDGLVFWRIEKEGIQGGCPNKRGDGRIGYSIRGEFRSNGIDNEIELTRGALLMARVTPDSASCQFTLLLKDMPRLDGNYAGFGRVIEGMDIADEIGMTRTIKDGVLNRAAEDIVMEKVTVDTFGIDYPQPEKLPELSKEERDKELKKLLDKKRKEQ